MDEASRVVGLLSAPENASDLRKAFVISMLLRMDLPAVVAAGGAAALADIVTCPGGGATLRRAALEALLHVLDGVAAAAADSKVMSALARVATGECDMGGSKRKLAGLTLATLAARCLHGGASIRAALFGAPLALRVVADLADERMACASLSAIIVKGMSEAEERALVDAGTLGLLTRLLGGAATRPDVHEGAAALAVAFAMNCNGGPCVGAMLEAGTAASIVVALRRSLADAALLGSVAYLVYAVMMLAFQGSPSLKAALHDCGAVPLFRSILENDAAMAGMVPRTITSVIVVAFLLGDIEWVKALIKTPRSLRRLVKRRECVRCDASPPQGATFKVCGKCKAVRYCGEECQRVDLEQHKMMCGLMEHAAAELG